MQTLINSFSTASFSEETSHSPVPAVGGLPTGIVFTERFAAALRAFLVSKGIEDYVIFGCSDLDFYDAEKHLKALNETAQWETTVAEVVGGFGIGVLTQGDWGARLWEDGMLWLKNHEVVIARRYWVDPDQQGVRSLRLFAAKSTDHVVRLRDELRSLRSESGAKVWQMIRGGYDDPERTPRVCPTELYLSNDLLERIEVDIVRFFSEEVATLHRTLGVPYRRGVLMYGPPGNGKTSIIRKIGYMLSSIPAMILRPSADFDTDSLEAVVKRWTDQAPAILVIEDLDWLLKAVNVSTFLNMLDGIAPAGGGLMLIATTNHPEQLDAAVNNRPGRFDVTIEVTNPDTMLRENFLLSRLPEIPGDDVRKIAGEADGLSFAHLQEILRLSGFFAIHAGRTIRTMEDLQKATGVVLDSHYSAARGFGKKLEVSFGLVSRKR